MRPYRTALVIISAGLLTFGVVFTLLQVTRSEAAAGQPAVASIARLADEPRAVNSLASTMAAGEMAVGVPIGGSEPLVHDVQTGDRLDVLASLASSEDGRPLTAVVVRGATVLRQGTSTDPLLLEVDASDALVLAHLVLRGTHLGYAVWPAGGSPPPLPALDERTARALLGLAPIPEAAQPEATPTITPAAPPATAVPTAVPVATPLPQPSPTPAHVGGFIYQAQPGDSWDSVAATFKLSSAELRQWNEAAPDAGLDPGTLLFVPRR